MGNRRLGNSAKRGKGGLFVFEGPDGTGKSAIIKGVQAQLSRTRAVTTLALPGAEFGSLGLHVYKLHHDPSAFGVHTLTTSSRQILHVAAHAEAVETQIRPRLSAGETILLDRYWWSMWVYGSSDGLRPQLLNALVSCEEAVWRAVTPSAIFLITRSESLRRADAGPAWHTRQMLYTKIARRERNAQPVWRVPNDGSLQDVIDRVIGLIDPDASCQQDLSER